MAAGVQVLPTTTKAGSKLIASGVADSIERMKSDPRTAEFMKDNPPPSNEQIEANWAKLLRSRKTYNKKAGMTDLDEELLQETQAAMIENGKNEAFQEMVNKIGPQRVLVRRLTDDDTERGAAEYHAGITHVYEFKGVELDKRSRAKAVDVEPKSGIYHMTDAGGMASMLRHEYGHQVLDTLGRDRQNEFRKTFNGLDSTELKNGLTNYSAANPDELFAETVALMTHPKYKREEFPEFVGKLEDQIKGWINDYAAAKQ